MELLKKCQPLCSKFFRKVSSKLKSLDTSDSISSRVVYLHNYFQHHSQYPKCALFCNEESLLKIAVDIAGGKILERLIKHNYPCQTLMIESTDIDFTTINGIFNALKDNTNLKYFYVGAKYVNDTNLKAIAESLQENASLTTVLLDSKLVNYSEKLTTRQTFTPERDYLTMSQYLHLARKKTLQGDRQFTSWEHIMLHCLRCNFGLKNLFLPSNCDFTFFQQYLHRQDLVVISANQVPYACRYDGLRYNTEDEYGSQLLDYYNTSSPPFSDATNDSDD